MEVAGSVALITGAASGLGEGAARALVRRGARVVVCDLPSSNGAVVARELGDAAIFVPFDVTEADAVADGVSAAASAFGRIDLCVNAAGIFPRAGRMLGRDGSLYTLEDLRRSLEVNLVGTFDVTRHVCRVMSRQESSTDGERGLVVNVASIAAFEGGVGQVAYAAAKGAIAAMTLPLARELADVGIRVVTVCPGIMDTPMLTGVVGHAREDLVAQTVFPKRLGTPDDFGGVVIALLENPLLNGTVIRLDGGVRLRAS